MSKNTDMPPAREVDLSQHTLALANLVQSINSANTVVESNSLSTDSASTALTSLLIADNYVASVNPELSEGLATKIKQLENLISNTISQDTSVTDIQSKFIDEDTTSEIYRKAETNSIRTLRELHDSPALKAMNAINNLQDSPALKALKAINDSPAMRAINAMQDSPALKALKAINDSPAMKSINMVRESPVANIISNLKASNIFNIIKHADYEKIRNISRVIETAVTKNPTLNPMICLTLSQATLETARNFKTIETGKTGFLTQQKKSLGKIPEEKRQIVGSALNTVSNQFSKSIDEVIEKSIENESNLKFEGERIDVTLPSAPRRMGSIHPIMQVFEEVSTIFADMGFTVKEGPDIEDDFHNFTALNFPEKHPARDMHDTFFMQPAEDGTRKLLRTHTSPVQIRTMTSEKPPIRIVAPGRTYRCDFDQTHTPMFHQIEGLVIEEGVHMGHLKGVLMEFLARFFEVSEAAVRFRPHHFPFTEPSAEVDVLCDRSGKELKIGTGNDWLEILGCGMVHPNVLRACGIDPDVYQGFAFGLGIDRLAMLKYGIPDLRNMFESDVRWLEHFGFEAFFAPSITSGLSR